MSNQQQPLTAPQVLREIFQATESLQLAITLNPDKRKIIEAMEAYAAQQVQQAKEQRDKLQKERDELKKAHEDACVKGIACQVERDRAVEQSGWTSVTERLPEIGERVMIYCHSQGVQICHRGFIGEKIGWLLSFDITPAYLNITHWMPLPEPPKPDEPTKNEQ